MYNFKNNSYLSAENAAYVEDLYENYLKNKNSVDGVWQQYFSQMPEGDFSHADIRENLKQLARQPHVAMQLENTAENQKQCSVDYLIAAYRRFGHLNAQIDPLKKTIDLDARLALPHYNLDSSDLIEVFDTRNVLPEKTADLKTIINALQKKYCGTIGFECDYIENDVESNWLQNYIENKIDCIIFSEKQKKRILKKLTESEGLEKYLDTKFPGQKRFSIEGGESLIPMLEFLLTDSCRQNVREIVIGMAHRGRLNVMLNIMGQSPAELFKEFEGVKEYGLTSGDVKYHRGFSSDIKTDHGEMHLSLGFNPSHLEFIDPVVMGSVRSRQDRAAVVSRFDYAFPVMIHGDAAFIGQGIVMETLSMSQTRAYGVGGSIHIILNNQVGFTTSHPKDARSSRYCSDLSKMIDAPIVHVNGDDPEACVRAIQFALDYRMQFHKDFVIDLVCYRVHGHNEADDPTCTQPLMYRTIHEKLSTRAIYANQLMGEKIIDSVLPQKLLDENRDRLDKGLAAIDLLPNSLSNRYAIEWQQHLGSVLTATVNTAVSRDILKNLGDVITKLPPGFIVQRNVEAILKARDKMTMGEQLLDWGYAETMAYATLLTEQYPVRLTGEDVRRGTFFHRHAAIFDQKTGQDYMPLCHLAKDQARIQIYDSLLSETGTLGFEYGYASSDPKSLVIWEAQFGDFANGAQVIIDQFISSGWQKWNRLSGLVMLLPHGAEGMGPEHTSARLERYMQLCAQDNMQVCVPSTPAQIFHLLRRQVLRHCRVPLIVMSPKSLLRHKLAVSTLDELATGEFQCVIPEVDNNINLEKVERLVLCSGKVYYEILAKRREENILNIALIRIEQLYPFPYDALKAELKKYTHLKEIVWCQEEPKNQGAWFCTRHRIIRCLSDESVKLCYAGRASMAAPATGYAKLHLKQQTELVSQALNLLPVEISK